LDGTPNELAYRLAEIEAAYLTETSGVTHAESSLPRRRSD
jgi:hypothetical protein